MIEILLVSILLPMIVILVGFYFSYVSFLMRHQDSQHAVDLKSRYEPMVSVIIPVHNEESMIRGKLRNTLDLHYPKDKLEIVVFDNGCTDRTQKIARSFSGEGVRVLSDNSNRGVSAAINASLEYTKGELVAKTDADIRLQSNIMEKVVPHFKDPSVGAVMVNQFLVNRDENSATRTEGAMQDYYYFIRRAQSAVDSMIIGTGEFMIFRRNVIETLNEHAVDDIQIAILVRRKGYRVLFAEDAYYYEYAPSNYSDRWKQKVRRGAQVIQVLLSNRDLFLNRAYGPYGTMIFPAEFFMYVLSPSVLLMACLILALLITVQFWLGTAVLGSTIAFCLFLGSVLNRRISKAITRSGGLSIGYVFVSFFYAQCSLLASLLGLFRIKTHRWEKIASTKRFEN